MIIKNKFKIGEIVHFMKDNRTHTGRIAYMRIWVSNSGVTIKYELASYGSACGGGEYYETSLHKNHEDLIKTL